MVKHNLRRYRSGLEKETASFLKQKQKKVRYELLKIEWEDLRYRTYIFDSDDRRKHSEIRKQHPELDIRFVFSNARSKLYKGSKSRYYEWCEKNNFKWSHRVIPEKWLKEKNKPLNETIIVLKTKRKN